MISQIPLISDENDQPKSSRVSQDSVSSGSNENCDRDDERVRKRIKSQREKCRRDDVNNALKEVIYCYTNI
jgi:hypothetical protein